MTAKEKLLEYVQGLTEAEAIEKLPWIVEPAVRASLTAEEIRQVERAIESLDAGRKLSHAEMKSRFGLQ